MNHCGRPECECYKKRGFFSEHDFNEATNIVKKAIESGANGAYVPPPENPVQNYERDHSHLHCWDFYNELHTTHLRCCICYKEKHVQEKTCSDCNKPEHLHEYIGVVRMCPPRPVQETHEAPEKGASREPLGVPAEADTTTVSPDAGEWEKRFDDTFAEDLADLEAGFWSELRTRKLKSFIRSAIEQAEKRVRKELGVYTKPHQRPEDFVEDGIRYERSRLSEAIGKLFDHKECMTCYDTKAALLKVIHEV